MNAAHAIQSTLRAIYDHGIILCVRLDPGAPVLDAAKAAAAGGLTVLEITLTTPGALGTIETLSKEENLLIGAGTVLTTNDVRAVAEAGGRFVMSPVFDEPVLSEAERLGILAVPGASTSTEILTAYRAGARAVKVFPAAALGGTGFLRAVRGPLPHIPLIPTSGPTADTMAEYFAAGASAVGVGNEVFHTEFTLESVQAAAKRVCEAFEACASHRTDR